MRTEYIPLSHNPHGLEEEQQWVRLLITGDPVKGMVVIFLQKMCAAFHEFEPAFQAGALAQNSLNHYQKRLASRVEAVLTVLHNNGIDQLAGVSELESLRQSTLAAQSLLELARLAEPVHQANHKITDSLER
jgi:hypothetical protein